MQRKQFLFLADITLAEFGRKELILAENEMPGLMHLRNGSNNTLWEIEFDYLSWKVPIWWIQT